MEEIGDRRDTPSDNNFLANGIIASVERYILMLMKYVKSIRTSHLKGRILS